MSTTVESSAAPTDRATDHAVAERVDLLLSEHPPKHTHPREFLGHQFDRGLAWVHFPEGQGGLNVSPKLQKLVDERLRGGRAVHRDAQPDRSGHGRAHDRHPRQ